ncbi:MAG: hypothetical protein EBZ48_03175 [Proteobacteria bacterium]|nr:hypothetical protein [Pseudomonadota bacterium]
MGDDVDAPHQKTLSFLFTPSVKKLACGVASSGYLAKIQGGKATWVLRVAGTPVAVIAEQWSAPKYLVAPARKVSEFSKGTVVEVSVDYLVQRDPEVVFLEYSQKGSG